MDTEAVEGLPDQSIPAESRLSFEPATPVSPGELTHRQGEAVHQSKGGVIWYQLQESSPDQFLDLPEVSCLPGEGGPVHSPQGWEEVGVMAAEIPVKGLVLTNTQVFPTASMVRTSASQRAGIGPLCRRLFPLRVAFKVSSIQQKAVIINVSRFTTHLPEKSLSFIERCW
jgi:hypothetical protein